MDSTGFMNNKETVRAACKKCGYAGHLTYQCRNFVKVCTIQFNFLRSDVVTKFNCFCAVLLGTKKIDPNKEILLDVSSTSDSDTDYITPLTDLRKEELEQKERELMQRAKQAKKNKKIQKKSKSKNKKKKKRYELLAHGLINQVCTRARACVCSIAAHHQWMAQSILINLSFPRIIYNQFIERRFFFLQQRQR